MADIAPLPVYHAGQPVLANLARQRPVVLLALCTFWEARGESQLGKVAVAWSVRNRVEKRHWPNTYTEVILQPWQYSGIWEQRDKIRLLYPTLIEGDIGIDAWLKCVEAAVEVMVAGVPDPTGGATHYHAAWMRPSWVDHPDMHFRTNIGGHEFYEEIRG